MGLLYIYIYIYIYIFFFYIYYIVIQLLTMIKTICTDGLHKCRDGVTEHVHLRFYIKIDRETDVITQSCCTDPFSCTMWIY